MCWENPPCSKQFLQDVYLGLGSSTQLGRLLAFWSLAYQNGKFSVGKTRQTSIISQQPQILLGNSPCSRCYLIDTGLICQPLKTPGFVATTKSWTLPSTKNNMSNLKCTLTEIRTCWNLYRENNKNNILDLLISTLPLKRKHVSKPFPSPPPPHKKHTLQTTHRLYLLQPTNHICYIGKARSKDARVSASKSIAPSSKMVSLTRGTRMSQEFSI